MENHHKGWMLTILGFFGSVGSWLMDHGFGILLGLASFVSIIFAIKASRSAQRASDEEARLARLKSNFLICGDCIREELATPPEDCPHPISGPYPKGCMKIKNKLPLLLAGLLLAASASISVAQPTNLPASTNLNPAPSPWVLLVADDVHKLVVDFLSGVSFTGLLQALFAAYLGAKGLRNYTSLGNAGKIGAVLHLLNLEKANPAAPPLSPAIQPVDPNKPTNI